MKKIKNISDISEYVNSTMIDFSFGFEEIDLVEFGEKIKLIISFFEKEYLTGNIDIDKWLKYIYLLKEKSINFKNISPKGSQIFDVLNLHLQEIEKRIKTYKTSNKIPEIKPIQLDLNSTEIIYLFEQLIENFIIDESKNPNLWKLVSDYFVGNNGTPIKNIHQLKNKLNNSKTEKPKGKAKEIDFSINAFKRE